MQTVKTLTKLIGENIAKTLNYNIFFVFSETINILLLQRMDFQFYFFTWFQDYFSNLTAGKVPKV